MDHMASSIVDDPPPLDAELPTVLHDLVPLSYLVDRVVSSAYSDLATLVETLPSHPDQHRKRALVDYVLHTRRQLVKLLVLTRWSTEAAPIHKAMNLVGFLSRQNHAVDSSVAALADTATMLAAARVRNYDLATALDVLTLGTYPSLPASLSDRFHAGAAAPLSDDQVLDTLRDVDDVLRWRLVMRREHVPEPMTRVPWRIGDGRVVFTVPGMWEATLTYGGGPEEDDEGQEQAEWFLLGVTFLFRVADARGCESLAPPPPPPPPHRACRTGQRGSHAEQHGPRPRRVRSRSTSSTCATGNSCDGRTSLRHRLQKRSTINRHSPTARRARSPRRQQRTATERTPPRGRQQSRTGSRLRSSLKSGRRSYASGEGTDPSTEPTPSSVRLLPPPSPSPCPRSLSH